MNEINNQTNETTSSASQSPKSNTKKWVVIAVVVIVLLYVAQSFLSPQRIAERAIEQATGGNYKVDVNNGNNTIQVKGKDGQAGSFTAGENVSLPDNWPNSVPIAPDAKITYAVSVDSAGSDQKSTTLTVTYTSGQTAAAIVEYYKTEFANKGWTIESAIASTGGSAIAASKGEEEKTSLYITESDGQTMVSVTTQVPK